MVPDGWDDRPLGDRLKLASGTSRPSDTVSDADDTHSVPVYGGNGILGYTREANRLNGAILIGRVGEKCGITRFVEGPIWISDNALFSRELASDIDARFLTYRLQHFDLSRLRKKGGQPLITQQPIYQLRLSLPPLPEQKKIAEILSTWDMAIETTEKLIARAEAQKRALMQQLLTGKRRLKEFKRPEWRRVSLHSVFERVRRKNSEGNRNVLTISGKNGLVSQREYFSKIVASSDTAGYTLIQGEEFAYNKSYSAGYPLGAIKMLPAGQKGVLSSLYICFSVRDAEHDSSGFYQHWFEFGSLNRELGVVAQEGARNHGLLNVGITDFFDLQIVRPSHKEQLAIAEVLDAADKEIRLLNKQASNMKEQKKALMQQLLTGKRRVAI
jgi:type I restriction enzyme S subunit